MVENLQIYYFTGTGNAQTVSNWLANVACIKNIEVEIIRITPSLIPEKSIDNKTLIGFCYPTHGFNAPPIVIDFLLRFPKGNSNIFIVNTRAGMKLYKFFLPGLSGLAQLLPSIILRFKGYHINGLQPMDLPSNWISLHPGLKQKVVDSIFNRCEKITSRFGEKILTGGKIYKGLLSLPVDLLISPISIAYIFFGRFALSKTFIADYNCNNCQLCVKECPVNAIIMKNERPFWTRKCESCMHCMNRCPQKAIQTPHLFVLIIWWLVFSVVPLFVLKQLTSTYQAFSDYSNLIFYTLIISTGLPIIFFSYRTFHFLMRFRFFGRFYTMSSLTHFKFWRRYFAPNRYLQSTSKK
jgi:ferredoxin